MASTVTSLRIAPSPALHSFLDEHMKKAGCAAHDLDHCYRVANLACNLAEADSYQGRLDVLFAAGLLHDVFDSKLYAPDKLVEVEAQLRSILSQDVSAEDITSIFSTVNAVGYKNMLIPNRDISSLPAIYPYVQDADLLDAIGAIGVARCMAFSGRINRKLFSKKEDIISDLSTASVTIDRATYLASQQNDDAAATDHFHEKLLRIPGMMLTEPGRRMAAKREKYMQEFLERIREEITEASR